MRRSVSRPGHVATIAKWLVGPTIVVGLAVVFDPLLIFLVVPGLIFWLMGR